MKRALASLSLLSLALAACTMNGGTAGDTIKIGLIAPLTGDVAGLGADVLHGVEMAVEKINADGGLNGKKIQLIAEDGRCTGSDAAGAAQKLVNVDHVFAIVGGLCSGETLAAAPIVNEGKIVLLSPTSSSPDVTKAGDFVFRNYPSDALKTVAMAKYFGENKIAKIAMISENTDFSQGFRASLKAAMPEGAMVFDEVVDPGTKDFRSLMTRLKGMQFDMFFPNGNSDAVIGPMMQQLREAGITSPAIVHDAGDSATMAKNVPEVEGMYVINVPSDAKEASFNAAFKAKYGEPQYAVAFAGFAYDSMNVIAEGIKKGAQDSTALKTWMYSMPDFAGVSGSFHFDKDGDVVGIPYVLKQYEKGQIKTLKDVAVD
jgi:branched-chain amino acid transport system substrate-binding protein